MKFEQWHGWGVTLSFCLVWNVLWASAPSEELGLTTQEVQWLQAHPVIRVCPDLAWPPIEYLDRQGQFQGLSIEYLRIFEQKLGIRFEFIQSPTWEETLRKAKNKEVDVVSCIVATPERQAYLNFTDVYFSDPIMVFTGDHVSYISDLRELKGKRICVVAGHAIEEFLRRDYPELTLVIVSTLEEGLALLRRGEVFAFVDDLVATTYVLRQKRISNLKVTGDTPYAYDLGMGIRNDWDLLDDILQKTLDSIPEIQRKAIYQKWILLHSEPVFDYAMLWKILIPIAVFVVVVFIYWNYRLQSEVRIRREAENSLQQYQGHLEDLIAQRTKILELEIKERKETENALKESQLRFRTLVDNIPGISYSCKYDDEWTMKFISSEIETLSGYPVEDFLDNSVRSYRSIIHPDDQQALKDGVRRSLENNQAFALEYRIIRADGQIRWVYEKGQGICNEAINELYLDGVIVDITERKQGEREREQLLEALTLINEELESIIYVSSHDLRSPIINIKEFSRELKESSGRFKQLAAEIDQNPQFSHELLQIIDTDILPSLEFVAANSEKIDMLQQNLLELCYLGRKKLVPQQIEMDRFFSDIIDSMQPQIQRCQAMITCDSVPACFGDQSQLVQVFTHLLDNALKYVTNGQAPAVTISGRTQEGKSLYCIQDNGIGINPAYHHKIFEVFHRLTPRGPVAGVGTGLTVAKRIVERHNGRIWLDSQPGQGTCFYVLLPCEEQQIPAMFV